MPADQREEPATSDGDQYFFKTDYRFNWQHAMTDALSRRRSHRDRRRHRRAQHPGARLQHQRARPGRGRQLHVGADATAPSTKCACSGRCASRSPTPKATASTACRRSTAPRATSARRRTCRRAATRTGSRSSRTSAIRLGTHDLKFGADVSIIRADSFFPRNRDGNFTFTTDAPFDADQSRHLSDPVRGGDAGSDRRSAERPLLVLRAGSVAAADQPDAQPRAPLRSRNRLQQDHRRARRQQQLPAAARHRVGSVQRRQDRGARRLRPLRRSELPEHPAQRRVREGRGRDGDRQSGLSGSVLARHHDGDAAEHHGDARRSRTRRKRGPPASASSARSSRASRCRSTASMRAATTSTRGWISTIRIR